jgi:hypothetical protein
MSPQVIQFRRLQYRELTPEDYELLCLLDEDVPKKKTSSENVVTSLPRIPADECNATECSVCLGRIEPGACVVHLPCNHAFHPECVSKWLMQCKGTCPLCNHPVEREIVDVDASRPGLEVHSSKVKKIAHGSVGRCGLSFDGVFKQPGVGDDNPAE